MESYPNLKPWRPGQSGNLNGRPVGSRSTFSAGFTRDLAEVWAEKGQSLDALHGRKATGRLFRNTRAIATWRRSADELSVTGAADLFWLESTRAPMPSKRAASV